MADRLRLAMVGGGAGAFIGPVHLMAARLDGQFELVAGAFSRDRSKSREAGVNFGIEPHRAYADWAEMLRLEAGAVDVVAIVTPNDTHFPIARAALEAGFHVLCDKPATITLDEALSLRECVKRSRRQYGITYTYSGYPLVSEAKALIASGRLGRVRKILVEYSQGWLSRNVTSKQANWRLDPNRAGVGGCIGDIGVHAFHLAEYVSGEAVTELCADLGHVVPGRVLDDDCNILLHFTNGARGALIASQISAGERNGLRLRIYGEEGGIDWSQENPNILTLNWIDAPTQVLHAGGLYLSSQVQKTIRVPAGHPEGYIEAFANIYRDFADQVVTGTAAVPGVTDAVRSMHFVKCAIESSQVRLWRVLKDM